jgi:hypothetical protein
MEKKVPTRVINTVTRRALGISPDERMNLYASIVGALGHNTRGEAYISPDVMMEVIKTLYRGKIMTRARIIKKTILQTEKTL